MENRIVRYSTICGLALAAALLIFDWRWSAGIVIGLVFFVIYFLMLRLKIDEQLSAAGSGKASDAFSKAARMLILAVPLLLGFVFPEFISFWGVFIGLMMFRVTLVVTSIFLKDKFTEQ